MALTRPTPCTGKVSLLRGTRHRDRAVRFERANGTAVPAERESALSGEEVPCTGVGTAFEVRAGSSVTKAFL